MDTTSGQDAVYRELAAADARAAKAIAQRTARLRQLQETLAQVRRAWRPMMQRWRRGGGLQHMSV